MDYIELKKIENDINVLQAKLGLLRAELKKRQNRISYQQINEDVLSITAELDLMQNKYIKGKEAVDG